MKQQEIERKWLMDGFPDIPYEDEWLMEQGYLSTQPVTVRVRRTQNVAGPGGASFVLTIKGKGLLARTEVETPLDAEQFEALWTLLMVPGVKKRLRRYRLPDGHVMECSWVDEGEPTSFYYAEVEFETREEAHAFVPPPFVGREVTEEEGYGMSSYALRKSSLAAGQNPWRQP